MKNILATLMFIFTLFSVLLLSSLVHAEEGPLIAGPEVTSEDTAPTEKTNIIPEHAEESLSKLIIEPGASCITESCHAGMGQKKYVHAVGVDGMKCNRCHETASEGKHVFNKIPDETMFLCAQCHKADVLPPEDLKKSPPRVLSEDLAKKAPPAL